MVRREAIALEALNGDQFEKLCRRVFERAGYGEVINVQYVGDEGRDLLIYSPRGLTIVECKHQPHTRVGPQVLYKLHRAVLRSEAIGGIIVTTGRFSDRTETLAEKMSPRIRLMNRWEFLDVAKEAGIDVTYGDEFPQPLSYPVRDSAEIERRMGMLLDDSYVSSPYKPSSLASLRLSRLMMFPMYEINYSLDSVFKTSVGVVHHEEEPKGRLLISGDKGLPVSDRILTYTDGIACSRCDLEATGEVPRRIGSYGIQPTELKDLALNHIIDRHTRKVSYMGGNYVSYTKKCVPRKTHMEIFDISRIYLPVLTGKVGLLTNTYSVEFVNDGLGKPLLLRDNLTECRICSERVVGQNPRPVVDSHLNGFYRAVEIVGKPLDQVYARDLGPGVRIGYLAMR